MTRTDQCDTCPAKTLDRKQKKAVIEAVVRTFPHESNRRIASRLNWLGTDHKTVAKYRDRLIASGELPQVSTTVGKDGKRRRANNRPQNDNPIYTCYRGNNAKMIAKVAQLYFRPGDKIADVTYGCGAFWSEVDLDQYDFHASDLISCPDAPFDFTSLPYADCSFDVAALDPPYVTRGETKEGHAGQAADWKYGRWLKRMYRTDTTLGYRDILELFREGIEECYRVLKLGGLLLVKCCDESEGGQQRMTHIEVFNMAIDTGLLVKDLFVLLRVADPVVYGKQRVARKNHSYLWVFDKP